MFNIIYLLTNFCKSVYREILRIANCLLID